MLGKGVIDVPGEMELAAQYFILLLRRPQFKTYKLFISGIFHLFRWKLTAESETSDKGSTVSVSYTHLTLPTSLRV